MFVIFVEGFKARIAAVFEPCVVRKTVATTVDMGGTGRINKCANAENWAPISFDVVIFTIIRIGYRTISNLFSLRY